MMNDLKSVTKELWCPVCDKNYSIRKPLFILNDIVSPHPEWYCPDSNNHYRISLRKEANKVPKEIRQKLLDLMWKGEKLGAAAKECNISLDAASQILLDNIGRYEYLRREAI